MMPRSCLDQDTHACEVPGILLNIEMWLDRLNIHLSGNTGFTPTFFGISILYGILGVRRPFLYWLYMLTNRKLLNIQCYLVTKCNL